MHTMTRTFWLVVLPVALTAGLSLAPTGSSSAADAAPAYRPGPLLQRLLDGPMKGIDEIVFAERIPGRDHWYVNFGYYSCLQGEGPARGFGPYPDGKTIRGYGDGGRLCRLNLRTGKLRVLLDDPKGGVRDPQVYYDGTKILFSYRRGGTATYHLYEINIDGAGLAQLTDGPDDDIEPTYLPDGGIMFGSSRCRRFVNCWYTRVAALYRCDGDGRNVRQISSNNDHDNTPWVLHDGRVLYMRWEYVDRSQVHFHHLWTVNPDGTGQTVFYGNEYGGVAMLDAKPIPGTRKIVASFSPGHGRFEHMGHVEIVDPGHGPDDPGSARQVSKGRPEWRDPYAFSEDAFLVASRQGVFVMDGRGAAELVYALPRSDAPMECHEPRPLAARPRERAIPPRTNLAKPTAELVLADIYDGRNMGGVKRGEIKKLLILEQVPKPVNFSGGMEPLTIGGSFTLARILGTVPVDPDGSAFFEAPALRSLFFVALDENDLSVKRMQSFVTLQPGERSGCVGCHEPRARTAHMMNPHPKMTAMRRRPSKIEPIADVPHVIEYPRDVQPILDKHCVECHNADRWEGRVDLTGDHTPRYSISYWTMVRRRLFVDGRNEPRGNRAPRTIGSSASPLMKLIDGSHYQAKLSEHERRVIRLWIETSACYPGTYAALGCGMYTAYLPGGVLHQRCGRCHGGAARGGGKPAPKFTDGRTLQSMCNLTRPAKSLILRAPLAETAGGLDLCGEKVFPDTDDPGYRQILAAIVNCAAELDEHKRFDMAGFRPNEDYIREMQRFGHLPADLGPDDPIDVYATDRKYWQSFWYHRNTAGSFRSASR